MQKNYIQGVLRAYVYTLVYLSLLSCSQSKCHISKRFGTSQKSANPLSQDNTGRKVGTLQKRRLSVDTDIKLIEKYDRYIFSRLSCSAAGKVRKMAKRIVCRCEAGSGVPCYRLAWIYYSAFLSFRDLDFKARLTIFIEYMRKSCRNGYKVACFYMQYLSRKMKLPPFYVRERLYKATERRCKRNDLYACVSLAKAHLNAAFIEVVKSVREKHILRAIKYLDLRCRSDICGSILFCLDGYVSAERMTKDRYVARRTASYFRFACIKGKWSMGCIESAGVAHRFPKYFSQKEKIFSSFEGCVRVRGDAERCLWLEAKCASLFSKNLLTKDQRRLCATWRTLFKKAQKSLKPRCYVYVKGLLTCGKKPAR